jgi:hypothetical protein
MLKLPDESLSRSALHGNRMSSDNRHRVVRYPPTDATKCRTRQQLASLVSGIEASPSMPVAKLDGGGMCIASASAERRAQPPSRMAAAVPATLARRFEAILDGGEHGASLPAGRTKEHPRGVTAPRFGVDKR